MFFLLFIMPSSLSCGYPRLLDPPFGSYFEESDCLFTRMRGFITRSPKNSGLFNQSLFCINIKQAFFFSTIGTFSVNTKRLVNLNLSGTYQGEPHIQPSIYTQPQKLTFYPDVQLKMSSVWFWIFNFCCLYKTNVKHVKHKSRRSKKQLTKNIQTRKK